MMQSVQAICKMDFWLFYEPMEPKQVINFMISFKKWDSKNSRNLRSLKKWC